MASFVVLNITIKLVLIISRYKPRSELDLTPAFSLTYMQIISMDSRKPHDHKTEGALVNRIHLYIRESIQESIIRNALSPYLAK